MEGLREKGLKRPLAEATGSDASEGNASASALKRRHCAAGPGHRGPAPSNLLLLLKEAVRSTSRAQQAPRHAAPSKPPSGIPAGLPQRQCAGKATWRVQQSPRHAALDPPPPGLNQETSLGTYAAKSNCGAQLAPQHATLRAPPKLEIVLAESGCPVKPPRCTTRNPVHALPSAADLGEPVAAVRTSRSALGIGQRVHQEHQSQSFSSVAAATSGARPLQAAGCALTNHETRRTRVLQRREGSAATTPAEHGDSEGRRGEVRPSSWCLTGFSDRLESNLLSCRTSGIQAGHRGHLQLDPFSAATVSQAEPHWQQAHEHPLALLPNSWRPNPIAKLCYKYLNVESTFPGNPNSSLPLLAALTSQQQASLLCSLLADAQAGGVLHNSTFDGKASACKLDAHTSRVVSHADRSRWIPALKNGLKLPKQDFEEHLSHDDGDGNVLTSRYTPERSSSGSNDIGDNIEQGCHVPGRSSKMNTDLEDLHQVTSSSKTTTGFKLFGVILE